RPRTFVLDPEHEPAAARSSRTETNLGARRPEFVRVREQIDEYLRDALLVAPNHGQRVWNLHNDPLESLLDERLDELARGDHGLVERHVLVTDAELTRLDAHALEQVVDEPREPLRAALQRR